ncbi:MAG: hypothetical protein B5M53_01595 [Candidatus Cloacimonas sp. 4484_209]|nr:MAG: hypothetical protein B5M53_01595 [Candidatus Cloacimonas sp. 4484_209]
MIDNKETAKVIDTTNKGTALVLIQRSKMCLHCPAKDTCNPPLKTGKTFTVEVENPIYAKKGDTVVIGARRGTVVIASFWAYIIPAIFFTIGIWLGFSLLSRYITAIPKELLSFSTGIVLLFLSIPVLRLANNSFEKKRILRPSIISILENAEPG